MRSPARARNSSVTSPSVGATWGTEGSLGRLHAAGGGGARVGLDLRVARARARPHPSRDRGDQLRAGRDGDALHVHRVDADDEPRLELLARVRVHPHRLVRRRRRDPSGGHPPEHEGLRAPRRDRHDRAAHLHQRLHDAHLGRRGASGAEPVPDADDRDRRASRSRSRTSARSASSSRRSLRSGSCSSTRRSGSRCGRRRSTPTRRASSACA